MSDILKTKLAIAIGSVLIIALLVVVNSANFETEVNKHWAPLTWDDFDGYPPIFTRYGAGVASYVSLEYDSARSKFVAYAYQNNVKSWVKSDTSSRGLQHEQYHFNITEIIARQLNAYIKNNPEGTVALFRMQLESLNHDLRQMQADYDRETNHSTIIDKQRLWEYRIDSLLSLESGWVTDPYSGGQAYFAFLPDSSKGIVSVSAYRQYRLARYGMYFTMVSLQNPELTTEQFLENMNGKMKGRYGGSVDVDSGEYGRAISLYDSGGYRNKRLWVCRPPYVYYLHAQYDYEAADTSGYAKIANRFINSFGVRNTDDFWIRKSERDTTAVIVRDRVAENNSKRPGQIYRAFHPQARTVQGFFRGPIQKSDGSLLIAYDFVVHPDSLHLDDVVRLENDRFLIHKPKRSGQLYRLPTDNIPGREFHVMLGYLLKEDSAKRGLRLFQHEVFIRTAGM